MRIRAMLTRASDRLARVRGRIVATLAPALDRLTQSPPMRVAVRTAVTLARCRDRLARWPAVQLAHRTVRESADDDATLMAAAVAYYAILSLFPLALGMIALFSPALESGAARQELLDFAESYLPGSGAALEANVASAVNVRGVLGVISVAGLFWAASAIFGAVSKVVNRAWDVYRDRPFYIAKVRHLLMALCASVLFAASLSITATIQFLQSIYLPGVGRLPLLDSGAVQAVAHLFPFVFSLAIFLLVYKYVPNTRTYWRYIWPGALLAAVSFELSKTGFILYLNHFADYERVYGSLGSIIVLLVWTYVSALILIVGAEFASEYGRMARGVERGHLLAPSAGRGRREG